MRLTTTVLLDPEAPATVLALMRNFNRACDWLAAVAFDEKLWHWLPLQRRAYRAVRERFGLSSAQAVVAVRKVASAYAHRRRRTRRVRIRPLGAIPLYKHAYKRDGTVSFCGLRVPFRARPTVTLSGKHQATLSYRNGKFIIQQALEVAEAPERSSTDILGCDLGITNMLVDSEGASYSGAAVEDKRRRYGRRRRNLQRRGTRAARRKLRKISGRQARYQRDINHQIAKRVVAKAQRHCHAIALEQLQGIRGRITARRRQRSRLTNWSFSQLQRFIVYKAALAGVRVLFVSPEHTSQRCPACGLIDRRNRRSQEEFCCVGCGLAGCADAIAARNIRARASWRLADGRGGDTRWRQVHGIK